MDYFETKRTSELVKLITKQSIVSTAIASTIDTLHNTINGYEIARIWNSKYNVHVCMIQTNFIFQKLIVFVSC